MICEGCNAELEQWSEARRALSRRVELTEEASDRQATAQTVLESRVADLEARAIFAQRRSTDQRTVVLLLPADQVPAVLRAAIEIAGDALAVEVVPR